MIPTARLRKKVAYPTCFGSGNGQLNRQKWSKDQACDEVRTRRALDGRIVILRVEGRERSTNAVCAAAHFRMKTIWLPECDTNPNTVVESPARPQFSALLTEAEDVESKETCRGWLPSFVPTVSTPRKNLVSIR